jgi:hypothetical protein
MRSFACAHCGQLLFFENTYCLRCGAELGFIPDRLSLCTIEPVAGRGYRVHGSTGQPTYYKRCSRAQLAACNWLLSDYEGSELCRSCRLTLTALKLRHDADLQAFAKAEAAKRRLIYQLLDLGLPIVTRGEDPARGLAFELAFRSDAEPILTGHLNGVISVDLSECDNSHRERLRELFGEPYRTLLGHFRHEIGHYYWKLLVDEPGDQPAFRERFGDERADYATAIERNYQGPKGDWSQRFVSAYAASHPWEDWAETFAHYLHIRDTLQTAAHFGLRVSPRAPTIPPLGGKLSARASEEIAQHDFESVIAEWLPLTYAFNAANRSMGKEDLYPFVLAATVIDKLAFVHDLVRDVGASRRLAAEQVSDRAESIDHSDQVDRTDDPLGQLQVLAGAPVMHHAGEHGDYSGSGAMR